MNRVKRTFLVLLQGNVFYEGVEVPVVIKDYPIDTTPSITISGFSRDKGKYFPHQITVKRPLPDSHPLFDENNPSLKYPFLAESTRKSYEIQINVWCNNEKERELIVNQVKECLFLCRNHHYKYCINFDKETQFCKSINETCASLKNTGFKGLRGQCPAPKEYHYCNLFKSMGIIRNTIRVSPDYELDEYDKKPPLKRSIIDVDLDFYDIFVFDSNPTNCMYVDFGDGSIHLTED